MNIPTAPINPKPGDIWRVRLNPVEGSEQGKTRPIVVLSAPPIGRPTVRLCAPIIHAQAAHGAMPWCVLLSPDADNGLTKESAADAAQMRALDLVRFEAKLGEVSPQKMSAIRKAGIFCLGSDPE